MRTLIERARSALDQIERLKHASEEKRRFDRLVTRCGQITLARDGLDSTRSTLRILRTNGITVADLPEVSPPLRNKAPALRRAVDEDLKAFSDDDAIKTKFVEPVKRYAEKLEECALRAWKDHVDGAVPTVSERFLEAMTAAGFKEQCEEISKKKGELETLRRTGPDTNSTVQRVRSLSGEIQDLWKELKDVPDDVVSFLRKAAARQATINDLTPGIQDWLRDHDLIKNLRIGLG